jgi:ABC-type transport system substrate-binding protein
MSHSLLLRFAATLLLVASSAGCSVLSAGALRVAVTDEPLNLSAAYLDESSALVGGLVQAGLYRPDAAFRPQPLLADGEPEISAGGTTWSVKLKIGLTFHDGSLLTSDDVAFTYELAKSGQCPLAADICDLVRTRLESVEADGGQSVTFRLISSWAPWGTRGLTIPILPKAALERSLDRFRDSVKEADRSLVTLARENIVADLDATSCGLPVTNACEYAPFIPQLERTLSQAGLSLPDPRMLPALNGGAQGVAARNDEAYAKDLFGRLTRFESYLLTPAESQLEVAYPLLDAQLIPVGAGPYKFVERTPGESLALESFSGFALGEPLTRRVLVRRYATQAGAISAFQASQLDWVPYLSATSVAGLQVRSDATLLKGPSSRGYLFLAFNMRPGRPFADPVVRSALSSCVDLPLIISEATGESGIPISSTVAPNSWAAPSPAPAEAVRDTAGARASLVADGWSEEGDGVFTKLGSRLEASILVRDGQSARTSAAQLIADQAAECGFSLTVSAQAYTSEILPRLRYPNDFDAYIGSWQWSLDPDDSDLFSSAACPTEESPSGKNFACWQSGSADSLLRQGLGSASESARAPLYAQFQELRRSERPYLLLWADAGYTLLSSGISWPTEESDVSSPLYSWSIEAWSN